MAQRSGNSTNTWIIAGSIVLAGLLIMIAILVVSGGDDEPKAGSSPSIDQPTDEPTGTPTPRKSRSPRPKPSPTPTPSPSPSPSPTVDPAVALRALTQKQADRDRPGEVKHVGQVELFKDSTGCPQTGQAASVYVRFSTQPKFGIYIWCEARVRWKYHDGPIYGE